MKIRHTLVGMLAVAAGFLAACTPAEPAEPRSTAAPAAQTSVAAEKSFGPDGYGKLTIAMTEKEALATGELQDTPVSTVSGKNVYSLPGGPKPDPKRMKADEKIAAAAAKAEKSTDTSAAGHAKNAKAYADETQRITDRLEAYLDAGGAAFIDGITGDVENAAQDAFADRHGNGRAGGLHRNATLQAFAAAHRDGADPAFAEVLLHFEDKAVADAADLEINFERVVDFGEGAPGEIDVHDGADDLDDGAGIAHRIMGWKICVALSRGPSARW